MNNANKDKSSDPHKTVTPSSKGDKGKASDPKFTSYDTGKEETSTPQKVKKEVETDGMHERYKKMSGEKK